MTTELAAPSRLRLVGATTGRSHAPAQACDELERLYRGEPFDLLVLRGYALARQAARRPQLAGRRSVCLTDIEQDPAAVTADRFELTTLAEASDHLRCAALTTLVSTTGRATPVTTRWSARCARNGPTS
ncbi:MAG TPA: hypothetical protein VK923_18830 [Euzebyales bacterium]|nr:hypothetical protein [Euzebyales bacterium]